MAEIFNSEYAKQFLNNNSEVVKSWEKSSDPIRTAIAILLRQVAGETAAV